MFNTCGEDTSIEQGQRLQSVYRLENNDTIKNSVRERKAFMNNALEQCFKT